MKVLQFICPAGLYGAEMWILALKNALNNATVECHLAVSRESIRQDLAVADRFAENGGRVHYLDMKGRFDPGVIGGLRNLLQREAFDIIHTHGYKSDIIGLAAARLAGVAAVATPHGFENVKDLKLQTFIRIGSFALRFFNKVAPLSEELIQDMRRIKVAPRKVRLIKNGVDLSELEALPHKEPKSNDAPFTIGYVGQMAMRKNVGDLIRCFDLFNASVPESRLMLVGDGPMRRELENLASGMASSRKIQFTGYRADRLELMREMDLFCMTSSLEGIPRCMMEAMGLGIPAVAFNIAGVDQLIDSGKTGLLAPFGDTTQLCRCWMRIYTDPLDTERLARNGRDHILENFSAHRMAREYVELYQEMLDR